MTGKFVMKLMIRQQSFRGLCACGLAIRERSGIMDVTGKNQPKYYGELDAWIQMKFDIAVQIDVDYGLQDVQ